VRPPIRLRVTPRSVVATVERHGVATWRAEAPIAGPDDLGAAMAAVHADAPNAATVLDVEVDAPLVQRRTLVSLPPVSGARLRALVALQATRFFRRNGHPLITDARWNRGDRSRMRPWRRMAGPAAADAAALDEQWAHAILDGAAAAGLHVRRIAPTGSALQLLPPSELGRRRHAELQRLRRLAAWAIALWLVVGVVYLVRLIAADRRHREEIVRLRRPAAAVALARRELDRAAATLEAMRAADAHRAPLVSELAAIAAALPDSAYLTSLAFADDARSGTLSGSAVAATRVVPRIAGALSADARLASTPVPDTTGSRLRQRFTIVFALRAAR
jgi:hypothetical protein